MDQLNSTPLDPDLLAAIFTVGFELPVDPVGAWPANWPQELDRQLGGDSILENL